ncbi:hypothetical protein LB504_013120 [Fusarium proliferatum]|nr:hypothetical protein LB504_013120 [Fusarium proliferatum]
MPSTTDAAKASLTYMVQQRTEATYQPERQNTNGPPIPEIPWPSELIPEDGLPDMGVWRETLEKHLAYMSAIKDSRQGSQT